MTEPKKILLVFLVIMTIGLVALLIERIMEIAGRWWIILASVSLAVLILLLTVHFAQGRDFGQFNGNSELKQWYQDLMQPDNPAVGCCGEADAYWADSFETVKDKETGETNYVAIITDERPDEPFKRKHVPVGTRFVVPNHKIKFNPYDPQRPATNPTGHGVIFLSASGFVYCYVTPGGV